MRLSNYITEKTLDANELKRALQKLEKMGKGEDKDEESTRLMGELDKVRDGLEKSMKLKTKSKEWQEFDRAYEPTVNAIGALSANLGNTNKIMKMYQHWINVSNGILNKRK